MRQRQQVSFSGSASKYCPAPDPVEETFAHDLDGDMTQDGTLTYTWDGENRLHSVQTRVDLGADPDDPDSGDKYLEFDKLGQARLMGAQDNHLF